MKALLSVLLIVLASPTLAQEPSSISIGDVRLSLGAPQESVLRSLRGSFDISPPAAGEANGHFGIGEKGYADALARNTNALPNVYGYVTFRAGRLSSVEKFWPIAGPDVGVGVVKAIHAVVSGFGKTSEHCRVETTDVQKADMDGLMEQMGVDIVCGQRQLFVVTKRWTHGDKSGEWPLVNEALGEP